MKKYNLSNIMKRAWEMVKKLGFGISEALKKGMEGSKRRRNKNDWYRKTDQLRKRLS